MREIILDTETTGLSPEKGARVVEIACLELENLIPTGKHFQCYLNPECKMEESALAVHNLTDEFLRDKPLFEEVAQEFLDFVGTARLVIHNAPFDMGFLRAEFARLGRAWDNEPDIIDTLEVARKKFPGAPASLDALCKRFEIDLSGREAHGALIDTQLLAEVYLHLSGGRQIALGDIASIGEGNNTTIGAGDDKTRARRAKALPARLTAEEEEAHRAFVKDDIKDALWLKRG